jgi:hypothetical protein
MALPYTVELLRRHWSVDYFLGVTKHGAKGHPPEEARVTPVKDHDHLLPHSFQFIIPHLPYDYSVYKRR